MLDVARALLERVGQLDHGQIAGAYFAHLLAPLWGGPAAERVDWLFKYIRALRRNEPGHSLGGGAIWWTAAESGLRFTIGHRYLASVAPPNPDRVPLTAVWFQEVIGQTGALQVWSALAPDATLLKGLSIACSRHPDELPEADELSADLLATFQEGSGLPRIHLSIGGNSPLGPEQVLEWYRRGPWRNWQHRLWDGRGGLKRRDLPRPETLIRGWTLYALDACDGLPLRDSLQAWNSIAPRQLRLSPGRGALVRDEPRASRERKQARAAGERVRASFARSPLTS